MDLQEVGGRKGPQIIYLSVKNPSTEKREKKRREEDNREKEITKKKRGKGRERRDNESEFFNIFLHRSIFGFLI